MHATVYSHTSIKMQQIKMYSIYRTFAAVKIKLPFPYHFSIRLFSLGLWKLTVELLFFYIPWIKHPLPCPSWLKINTRLQFNPATNENSNKYSFSSSTYKIIYQESQTCTTWNVRCRRSSTSPHDNMNESAWP